MVRKGAFCVLLFWSLLVGLKGSLSAQSVQTTFNPDPLPRELKKVKPCRDVRWNLGTIKSISKESIESYLCYAPTKEVLLSYENGKVRALSAYQIESFSFFDQDLQLLRRYRSIPNDLTASTKKYQIYEMIQHGEFSLLRKETNGNAAYKQAFEELAGRLHFDYYIWNGERVLTYRGFQKEFLPSLALEHPDLQKWIIKKERPSLTVVERRRMIQALNRMGISFSDEEKALAKN